MSQAGLSAAMGIESLPFKAVQGAELPLFVPESPMSKFTMGGSTEGHAMLDAAHNGFDLSKTPTLAMFSETALRNRSAQQFGSDKVTAWAWVLVLTTASRVRLLLLRHPLLFLLDGKHAIAKELDFL